ncbi:MAG: hypothetical protein HOA57_01415 [Candidatus Magasanikbacteria bacterium]|jgi:hypothetical protein|nr:hypothetical protein [Candidatus Magasanikbacteria bacterium]MBT4315211.1 hypothetical protein [Candidatus Magasanikbacteria bacterium]MBT4547251.1 hypothetical protein [Candidatus Magasanikbacteria bacterium]MBT6819018.1 hypothetical protein [Candidatus Magasanikbacteria bacterium]
MDRIQFFIAHRAMGVRRVVRSTQNGRVNLFRRGAVKDDGTVDWVEVKVPGDHAWTFSARCPQEFAESWIPIFCWGLGRRMVRNEKESTATQEVWVVETEMEEVDDSG